MHKMFEKYKYRDLLGIDLVIWVFILVLMAQAGIFYLMVRYL